MVALTIAEAIERLRQELEKRAANQDLQDPEVIQLSQQLDRLIVEYYRLGGQSDED